jgi:hypothetical protein
MALVKKKSIQFDAEALANSFVSAEALLHTNHEKAHLCGAVPHFHNREPVASPGGDIAPKL